jgi:hypothetical protein
VQHTSQSNGRKKKKTHNISSMTTRTNLAFLALAGLLCWGLYNCSGSGLQQQQQQPIAVASSLDGAAAVARAVAVAPTAPPTTPNPTLADCTPLSMDAAAVARRDYFSKVYESKAWAPAGDAPLSGSGSSVARTAKAREGILLAIERVNAKSFVDTSCGDLTWMPLLFPEFVARGVEYRGQDIVPSLIAKHQQKHGNPGKISFCTVDGSVTPPPKADILFSRESLQHLSLTDGVATLRQWKASGSRFLLMTDYQDSGNCGVKRDGLYEGGTNHVPSYEKTPYNFPPPIAAFPEQNPGYRQVLALWDLQALNLDKILDSPPC